MEIHTSHRHRAWDDAARDYLERRQRRIQRAVARHALRATSLHLTIKDLGHQRTECSAYLTVAGAVLSAEASSHSIYSAIRDTFQDLERQIERQGVRRLPRPQGRPWSGGGETRGVAEMG